MPGIKISVTGYILQSGTLQEQNPCFERLRLQIQNGLETISRKVTEKPSGRAAPKGPTNTAILQTYPSLSPIGLDF